MATYRYTTKQRRIDSPPHTDETVRGWIKAAAEDLKQARADGWVDDTRKVRLDDVTPELDPDEATEIYMTRDEAARGAWIRSGGGE